jgi:murein DD-endopeptidase MepM/ murein hydrolase activator NlpD
MNLREILSSHQQAFHPIVSFDPAKDKLLAMDFTAANNDLTSDIIENTERFSGYIKTKLEAAGSRFGIGGYAENRTVYSRSGVFDADEISDEPRRLHLGVDIWGSAGEPVFAPLEGKIHSFAFNDHYGDYGATLILEHEVDGFRFHTLYGHISKRDIQHIKENAHVAAGQEIAHFGLPFENGHWPPHLHLQIIIDLENNKGDYIGVCRFSERERYLANCPDPDWIINLNRFRFKV